MRTFIGVDFDREIKNGIAAIQGIVRENSDKGRFKYIGNFHLTLKFLGEIDNEKVPAVSRMLKQTADSCSGFVLNISKLGCFNGKDSIHALWLGLGGEIDSLKALYCSIEENMNKIGLKKENKEYVPHITIAQDLRLKTGFEELKHMIDLSSLKPIEVREVSFIKSEEIGGKRVYTPIAAYKLK